MVNPSSRNFLASVCFSVPITPTIPQQSVVTDEESDVVKAIVAAAAAIKAAAFAAFHTDFWSESEEAEAEDDSAETVRLDTKCAVGASRCWKRSMAFLRPQDFAIFTAETLESRYRALWRIIFSILVLQAVTICDLCLKWFLQHFFCVQSDVFSLGCVTVKRDFGGELILQFLTDDKSLRLIWDFCFSWKWPDSCLPFIRLVWSKADGNISTTSGLIIVLQGRLAERKRIWVLPPARAPKNQKFWYFSLDLYGLAIHHAWRLILKVSSWVNRWI